MKSIFVVVIMVVNFIVIPPMMLAFWAVGLALAVLWMNTGNVFLQVRRQYREKRYLIICLLPVWLLPSMVISTGVGLVTFSQAFWKVIVDQGKALYEEERRKDEAHKMTEWEKFAHAFETDPQYADDRARVCAAINYVNNKKGA